MSRRALLVGVLLLTISPLWAQSVPVRIHVTDPTGWMLPGAQVTLLGSKDKPILPLTADQASVLVWENLPCGKSRFRVGMPGFYSQVLMATVHSGNYEEKVEVTLQPNNTDYYQVVPAKRRWWQIFR